MIGGDASHDIGRLYAVIAIMDGIGSLVAGPLFSLMFRWGLKLGGDWLGLPFLLTTALFLLITAAIFAVRLQEDEHEEGGLDEHASTDRKATGRSSVSA